MKKFLSLCVMIMTSAMSFATDYKDVLDYNVYGIAGSIESLDVSITDEGDNLYTIVLKNVDVSPVLGMTLGDLTIEMIEGTTENGVTTIESDGCPIISTAFISEPSNVTLTALKVKFNDEKAYIYIKGMLLGDAFDYDLTFGTDNFGTGTAIHGVSAADGSEPQSIYTMSGQQVDKMHKGLNIVRLANGKTVKIMNR